MHETHFVLQQVIIHHISFNNWHFVRLFHYFFSSLIYWICLGILWLGRHHSNPIFIFYTNAVMVYSKIAIVIK